MCAGVMGRWFRAVHRPGRCLVQGAERLDRPVVVGADVPDLLDPAPVGCLVRHTAGHEALVVLLHVGLLGEVLAVGDGEHHHADACEDVAVIV